MATTTSNFGLRKPTVNDNVNVALDIAANMDLLDAHAHSGTYERTYIPAGLDPTGVASASAAIQTAIDAANAAGGGTVLIDTPGTYKLTTRYMAGYTDIQAAIWLRSNVHLRCVPGVTLKLENSVALLAGVTLANQRCHVITVIDPYAVAGAYVTKRNIRLTGIELDCNAAGQSAQTVYAGIYLGAVDGAWHTDCNVYDLYGTASGPPGETMCFELRSCRNVHYAGCNADGQGTGSFPLANTSSGFSANYSHDVAYTGCTAHDFTYGQGFTVWQCSAVRYPGCHAYRCIAAAGFNCERSSEINYNGSTSGGLSPTTDGDANLPTTWFATDTEDLGNYYGYHIHGGKGVVGHVVARYNQYGVYVNANIGIAPTMNSDGVIFSGDLSNNTSGNEAVAGESVRTWIGPYVDLTLNADLHHRSNAPHELFAAGNLASGLQQTVRGVGTYVYRMFAEVAEVFRISGGFGVNNPADSDTTDRPGDAEFFYNLKAATVAPGVISGAGKVMVADTDFKHRPGDGAMAIALNTTDSTTRLCVRSGGVWGVPGGNSPAGGPTAYRATATVAETIPRNAKSNDNLAVLASGRLTFQAIWLDAGTTVTSISFTSWTTLATTPTNQWFALYSLARAKLGVTNDDLTTAWAAFTRKTLNLATPYVVTASGLYYVGCMVAAATPPTLAGAATAGAQVGDAPITLGNDATNVGLTTPATAPATAAALTGGTSTGGVLVARLT